MPSRGQNLAWADGPWCPIPYFYNETWSYLAGNIHVLDRLPAAQIRALRKARHSKTPVACQDDNLNSTPPSLAETRAPRANLSQEKAAEQLLRVRIARPPNALTVTRPPPSTPFQGMADRAMMPRPSTAPNTLNHTQPRRKDTGKPTPNNLNHPRHLTSSRRTDNKEFPLVYDGLRSCPPLVADDARTWRPYTGLRPRPGFFREEAYWIQDV